MDTQSFKKLYPTKFFHKLQSNCTNMETCLHVAQFTTGDES